MTKKDDIIMSINKAMRKASESIFPVDYPLTEEQEQKLIHGGDSVHIVPGVFPLSMDGTYKALSICKTIEERGGIRGRDYIICVHNINDKPTLIIDTTDAFYCDEDLIK